MVESRGGTRERIQAVARELFAQKGVERTSLQEIADRIGITKPALYYHFASREELIRSIVQPFIDEGEAFLLEQEALESVDPRSLLEGYFDFHYRRRDDIMFVLAGLTLVELGLFDLVVAWRTRLAALLIGPDPSLAQAARATIALGGIQDCTVQFRDEQQDRLRRAAVDGAMATLGLGRPLA